MVLPAGPTMQQSGADLLPGGVNLLPGGTSLLPGGADLLPGGASLVTSGQNAGNMGYQNLMYRDPKVQKDPNVLARDPLYPGGKKLQYPAENYPDLSEYQENDKKKKVYSDHDSDMADEEYTEAGWGFKKKFIFIYKMNVFF